MRSSFGWPGPLAALRSSQLGVWRLLHWFGLLLCLLCAVSPAEAQDAKARARSLFGEGVAAFERGDFENALESFTQAYRLAPHPAVRVNMANCYEQLGRYAEATFNYQRFLEESGPDVAPEQRADVEAAIERLRQKFGDIIVETTPADVSLSIDGASAQRGLDGRIQLRAGPHLLRATKPGYVNLERSIDVVGGTEQRVVLELESLSMAPAVPLEEPAAEGQASASDWRPASQSEPDQADGGSKLRPAMWITFGAAVLCGVGAGITGGLAIKAQNDFDNDVVQSNNAAATSMVRAQARANGLDASDRANTLAMVTDVLWISAAVGASTAFVLWMVDRKHEHSESSVALLPATSARGDAHLFLRGAF
ncbi:MAG: tetratricopeptide repeat protein [Myxococcales bacterium]